MSQQLYKSIAKNTRGKKIMLIGSSGNIGRRALDVLLQHGSAAAITAFDRKEPAAGIRSGKVTCCCGPDADITSPAAVARAMKGMDVVACAIGVPRFTAPGEKKLTADEIEAGGMRAVVAAAGKENIGQIIYISALGVARGDRIPGFHLGHLAKREAETVLLKSGIPYTILRPSGYFFDFRDLMAAAVAGRYHVVDDGGAKVQPLHHDDMAMILAASIGNKKALNGTIPLGGPEIFSYNDLGTLFGKVLKKKVDVIRLAPERYKREYFNSDVILFRATSDSVLTQKELAALKGIYPGLALKKLQDYLDNPDDPMLRSFFKK